MYHIGNHYYLSRDLVSSVASNLNPFRARRHKLSQADIYAKETSTRKPIFRVHRWNRRLKIAFCESSLQWRQLEYKGHISRGFHFAIRCYCSADQSDCEAGQAAVSFISWADRLLIWTNDKRALHNECQSSRFNHGKIMSQGTNGTPLSSLAYPAISVDFSEMNMYSAEVSIFDMKLKGRYDKCDIEPGFG